MADLIERDAAIARIDCCLGNSLGGRKEFDSGLMQARKFVISTPAVNRWISVEDALPDKKQKVLVFYKAIGEKNNIHDDVIATNWRKGNGDFIPFEGYEITHWMPLPEPPEKE